MTRNLLNEAGIEYKPSSRNLLDEANINYEEKEEQPTEKTSSLGALLRAAGRAPYDLAESLGAPHEKLIYPDWIKEKEYDKLQHPLAETAGSLLWGGPLLKELGISGKGIRGLKTLKDISNIKNINKNVEEAEQNHQQSSENVKNVQDFYGKSSIPSMRAALERAHLKMKSLENENPSGRSLSEQEPTNLQNRLPGSTGENLVPESRLITQNETREIQPYLGKGKQNDVLFQNTMNKMIKSNRAEIGSGYDKLKQTFENKNIELTKTKDISQIHKELRELISKGGLDTPEAKQLASDLNNTGKDKNISASSLLTQFRTLDKLAKQSYNKSFERNESLTEQQRNDYKNQAEEYQRQAKKLSDLLEDKVDPDFGKTLKQLNNSWRRYASLYKNPLGREIESQRGISGNNIFQKMRGEDAGQKLLQELTLSNPHATRAAIGHTYAENPEELLEAPEFEQQFIQSNPHLQGYMQRIKQSLQGEQAAERTAQKRQEEAMRVEKAYKEDVQLEKLKSEARDTAQQIEHWDEAIKDLEKAMKNEKANYYEKLELSMKLENARQNKERLKKIGGKLGSALLILGGIDTAISKVLKIFK